MIATDESASWLPPIMQRDPRSERSEKFPSVVDDVILARRHHGRHLGVARSSVFSPSPMLATKATAPTSKTLLTAWRWNAARTASSCCTRTNQYS